MTFRLFIDEVGNGDLNGAANDPNIRYLSLTGIITSRKQHDDAIQPELDRLKADCFGHTKEHPIFLHRRELVRREGAFKTLRNPDINDSFCKRLLLLLNSMPYRVITVAIDKKVHLKHYSVWHHDPYHYCMECLVERYILELKGLNKQGDVVVEPRYKKADKKLKTSFARIWENGTNNLRSKAVQERLVSRDLKFFPKTAYCAGLELCDLIAHPSFRAMKRKREGEQELQDFGYEIVKILEARRYRRDTRTGKIDGFGRKWLPF